MRLPWPFRRSGPEAGPRASVTDGALQRPEAPVRRDWRHAGTLRPSFVGDPGIRVQRFPDEIAGSQAPPPILAPLGHQRTADGPAGLVSGLARPTLAGVVQGSAGRADLPLRHRRVPAPTIQRAVIEDAPSTEGPSMPVALPAPTADPADGLPTVEPRRVAVVASVATASSTRPASLTIARTPDLALAPTRGVVPQSSAPQPLTPHVHLPAQPPAPALQASATGTPTRTILRTPGGSRVRLGPPIERPTRGVGAPSLELAPPPRPTSAPDIGARVQRQTTPNGDHAHPAATDAPLSGALGTTIEGTMPSGTSHTMAVAPMVPGGLLLARVVAPTGAPASDDGPALVPGPSTAEAPISAPSPFSVAPLVGQAIGRPGSLQRTASVPGPQAQATADPRRDARYRPGGSTAQRAMAQGAATRGQPAHPTVGQGATPAVRWASPTGATLVAARAATTGSQGRSHGSTSGRAERLTAPIADTPTPRATSSPSPAGPLTLARSAGPVIASANEMRHSGQGRGSADSPPPPVVVQRDASDPLLPGSDGGDGPATTSSLATATADTTATTPSGVPAAGATTIPERDLDEMVRRLYPRLRRSLTSELLVARERAGTLADLR